MTNAFPLALVAVLAIALPSSSAAQDHGEHAGHDPAPDSAVVAAIEAVVGDFHGALARGDTTRVLEILTPEARILESGGIETVEEYVSHHLPADMAFASAVERERAPLHVVVRGDVAWAASTSRATGTYRDREIDSRGAELIVLSLHGDAWRIEAVHWSSR